MTARRNFLALAAGAVGAGAALPVGAVGAVNVPIGDIFPPDHPDADLIRLCAENVESLRAFNADPQDAGDDNPFWLTYLRTKAAISEAKPQTIEGMVAKARAAKFQAIGPRGEEQIEFTCAASAWAWDLVNDLLRLHGRASA